MLRSGQYKMSGVGSRASGAEVISINQFKPMTHDFEETPTTSKSRKIVVDGCSSEHTDYKSHPKKYQIYSEKAHGLILEAVETRNSPTRKVSSSPSRKVSSSPSRKISSQKKTLSKALNRSCENLINPMNAVSRVEQKVKNLLHMGETKPKQDEKDHTEESDDSWQYGHLITLPRRNRRSLALSNSTISSFSDTSSCISGSSGYSSSSSSSCYGSFKSSSSASSTLLRKKSITESISDRSISQCSYEPRDPLIQPHSTLVIQPHSTLVDNPMYDITPAMARLYGTPSTVTHCDYPGSPSSSCSKLDADHENPIYDLPEEVKSQITNSEKADGLSCLEESGLGMECSDSDDQDDMENFKASQEDPVARECRQYFEQRLKNSIQLKKRWSLCSSDSGADSSDNEIVPTLNSKTPEKSEMPVHYDTSESKNVDDSVDNLCSSSHFSTRNSTSGSCSKSPFDLKMDFLRKEIAGLMKQDNALFRQLLALNDSIGALKTTTHQTPTPSSSSTSLSSVQFSSSSTAHHHQHHALRLNWADLTEEEEDDQEELMEDDNIKSTHDRNGNLIQSSEAVEEQLEDIEDEGLEVEHSISLSPSPNSSSVEDNSSLNSSPSPNSARLSMEDITSFCPLSSINSGSISLSSSPISTLSSGRNSSPLCISPIEDNLSLSIPDTPNSTVSPPSPNLSLSSTDGSSFLSVTYNPNYLLSHADDDLLLRSLSPPMSIESFGNSSTLSQLENHELKIPFKEGHLSTDDSSLTSTTRAGDVVIDGNKETQESNKFPSCSNNFICDSSKTRYPDFLLDTESGIVQPKIINANQLLKNPSYKFDNPKGINIEEKENSEHNADNGFIRCQKSYAPNARNRRRSSSVNLNPCKERNQRHSVIPQADLDQKHSRIPCLTQTSKTQIRERTSSSPFPLNSNSSTKFNTKLKVVNNSPTKLHEKSSQRCAMEATSSSKSRRDTQTNLRPLPRPPYREALIM